MRGRGYREGPRAQVLLDNVVNNSGLCTLMIKGVCTGKADTVHHTLGISVTGHDPRYMVATCSACNLHVGDPMRGVDPPHLPVTVW
jgi:hypothetical protein